jgi:hypothetical protein
MAHMNQERKAKIAARVKPILKKYGVKATLSVHNHSTICLNIASSGIDFIKNYNEILEAKRAYRSVSDYSPDKYMDVNPYWFHEQFSGKALEFLTAVFSALNLENDEDANFDKSDSMSDYFHVGWYVSVSVGRWNKPYNLVS